LDLDRDEPSDAQTDRFLAAGMKRLNAHRGACLAALAPHAGFDAVDVDIAEQLDEVVGVIVVGSPAIPAPDAHQPQPLIQGRQRIDAMSVGRGHKNELGTHTYGGQGWRGQKSSDNVVGYVRTLQQGRAIAVLIGGSNGAYAYDGETITRLIHAIRQLAAEGWTVLVSTSRRSEPTILRHLLELKDDRIVVWDRSGENPYRDFLAAADAFLVAKDSITMNCEAATTGRPVFSFDLARIESDKLQKFERFHDDMMNGLGLTRSFEGKIYEYPYEYPNESLRIANIVKEEIQRSRSDSKLIWS
jgi:hypothetical protein